VEPYQVLGEVTRRDFTTKHDYTHGGYIVTSPTLPKIPNHMRFISQGWEYRPPETNAITASGLGVSTGWHNDGGAMNAVMLWSNIYPTQIRLPNGLVITPKAGELILFDNRIVKHRVQPKYINLTVTGDVPKRHFLRAILSSKPDEDLINKWKKVLARES
jgi:hypothetical protein